MEGKNNTIQILRGDRSDISGAADVVLLDGQPFYNSTDNYLTIGGAPTGVAYAEPIAVKELHGPTGDNGVEYYIREESGNLIIQDNSEVDIKIGSTVVMSVTGSTVRAEGHLSVGSSIRSSSLKVYPFNDEKAIFTVKAPDTLNPTGRIYIGSNANSVEYQFAPQGPTSNNTMSASTGPTGKYYPVLDKATNTDGTLLKWIKEEDLMPAKVAVYSGSSTGTFTGYTIRQMSTSEVAVSIPNNSIIYVVD